MQIFNDVKLGESYEKFIEESFNSIKRKNSDDLFVSLPVYDKNKILIATLNPITFDYEYLHPEIVHLLGQWRKDNPSISDSQFEITDARTKSWLDNLILARKDRLLFLIDDLKGNHIGHIAYSSFDFVNRTAEIDSVLRGVKNTMRGLMLFSVHTLLKFGFENLFINDFYLSTSKNNERAINLYERSGFKYLYDIPLYKKELPNNEIRWEPDDSRVGDEPDRVAIKMKYSGDKVL